MINVMILFTIFFKIGLFTFGGGYAMISMMQQELIHIYHLMTEQEFIDIIAIAEMTPGVIAVNLATFLGYKVSNSIFGGILSTFGVILPSSVIVYFITHHYHKFKKNKSIQSILMFIKPAVIGIVASAASILLKGALVDYFSIIILAISVYLSVIKKVNPIIIIIIAGVIGIIIY